MSIEQQSLGMTPDNQEVIQYTMTNEAGAYVKLINIGATIAAIVVPDKSGVMTDVVLGYKSFNDYMDDPAALGKSVGRFANRIAKGHFTLDGVEYTLAINNGVNALHGGPSGFQRRVWASRIEGDSVIFSYESADGEEGYPGAYKCEVTYSWSDDCEISLVYSATCDKRTVTNLTNHVYFNLNGEGSGDILDHVMKINASKFLPTDETLIPTGERAAVVDTPMDFTSPKPLGQDIKADYKPLEIGKGYDHCWIIDNWQKGELASVAELYSPKSGIKVETKTTQPGIQIYTGNWLSGTGVAKAGNDHADYEGVAMECQNFPDSPNQPEFPSPVLDAGERYEQTIQYKFSIA